MLRFPRKTKYKQQHKLRISRKTFSISSSQLNYGLFGLKALKNNRLEYKQIEACRRVLTRSLKKNVKIQFRVSPLWPVSTKPQEIRMGKGKGKVSHWVFPLKAGHVILELTRLTPNIYTNEKQTIYALLKKASSKLNVPTSILSK